MANSVYLSPSIQDKNVGVGDYGTEEYRMNQIADIVESLLKYNNIKVYRNNPNSTLAAVVAESNKYAPDLHLAIHSNAGGGSGAEVFCWIESGKETNSYKYAKLVYDKLAAMTPFTDRGIQDGRKLMEINSTDATAILIEVAFHDNDIDAAWILNNINAIATAIAQATCEYFGLSFKQPSTTTQDFEKLYNEMKTFYVQETEKNKKLVAVLTSIKATTDGVLN